MPDCLDHPFLEVLGIPQPPADEASDAAKSSRRQWLQSLRAKYQHGEARDEESSSAASEAALSALPRSVDVELRS